MYWPSYGLELGRRLRILRIMRGLTQERLAELSGYSRNQISNLERNQNRTQHSSNPSMKMIYSLARALHVPPLVLLPRAERLVLARCDSGASTELAVKATWPETAQDVSRFSMSYLVGDAPSTEVRESPPFDLHLVRPDGLADDEWGSLIDVAATLSASEQKILEVLDKLEKREIKDQEEPGDR
nr:helix-turn-helix transcriptional regulator [Corynebacterium pyruviciproducens]